jgi:SP family sugar:H+ symporter-like MFS transporter
LAFFTPFITSAIDYRFGYVFAGCNLLAAIIVYFFLMESSQRTLEEVDTMYLTGVVPRKSAKWDPKDAGELVTNDKLYLNKGGRGIQKRTEGRREGSTHIESGVLPRADGPSQPAAASGVA